MGRGMVEIRGGKRGGNFNYEGRFPTVSDEICRGGIDHRSIGQSQPRSPISPEKYAS